MTTIGRGNARERFIENGGTCELTKKKGPGQDSAFVHPEEGGGGGLFAQRSDHGQHTNIDHLAGGMVVSGLRI